MSFYLLLQNSSFSPTEIERVIDAHAEALSLLSISAKDGPLIEVIGRKIIAIVKMCGTDLSVIALRALKD